MNWSWTLKNILKVVNDNDHKQLREGYGHIPKPQARKIKDYLYAILEDAWKYNLTMTNEREDEKRHLNKSELKLDRGFELMLRKQNSKGKNLYQRHFR